MAEEDDVAKQGVIVCVRVRPMFLMRPDGTPGREAECKRIVEMEGKSAKGAGCAVTKIADPRDPGMKPREFAFDRSYWSCDGFKDDPERPGFHIPDGPNSKYVSQDMVWDDVGQLVMKKALSGYNCTVFAYGQSGAGKSYSVVGYPPNGGIIPNTLTYLFDKVESNTDPSVKYTIEIAMLEVYMDEVYDLLDPRTAERTKMKVYINNNQVVVYDPSQRRNVDKIWRAARDMDQAEEFRLLGDANRSVRATGMNPSSSRGHTVFMCRFSKFTSSGGAWVEDFRSKISLVDLAGSERAHDTGLTGIGLKEGIAINQSLTYLGQVLVSLCKGERVNYRDKLTQILSESLNGTAATVMVAAISPADINYEDTLSTLRFADNAKKMPVNIQKQLSPTAQLIADLKAENARLVEELARLRAPGGVAEAASAAERAAAALRAADEKLAALHKEYEQMQDALTKKRDERSFEEAPDEEELRLEQEVEAQLQAIEQATAQRSEAREQATEARSRCDSGISERQLAVAAMLEAAVEAPGEEQWEDRLERADAEVEQLKSGFHEKGFSVGEMLGLMNAGLADKPDAKKPPYLVNLCEDAHDAGLLYFIPPGRLEVRRYVAGDTAPGIKLPGDTVEERHAILVHDADTGVVTIQPASEQAAIWVNGNRLSLEAEPVTLEHCARVILGFEFMFRFVDPSVKRERKLQVGADGVPKFVDLQFAIEELEEKCGGEVVSAMTTCRRTQVSKTATRRKTRQVQMRRMESFQQREAELRAEFEAKLEEERAKMRAEMDQLRTAPVCSNGCVTS